MRGQLGQCAAPCATSGDPAAYADVADRALAAKARSPKEAAELLAEHPAVTIAAVLQELAPALTQDVLGELPGGGAPKTQSR